jgi:hypothetical protein
MTKIIAENNQLRHKEAIIYRPIERSFAFMGMSTRIGMSIGANPGVQS